MIELLKAMLPAAMGDALTAQGFPAAGLAAASFAYALNALVPKRMKSAGDIWVQIVGRDWGALSEEQEEELASIVDTFLQIARKGTAKANLRLLARIIAGQKAEKELKADEFLYYADMIASMRREEIVLLGKLHNISVKLASMPQSEDPGIKSRSMDLWEAGKKELIPELFPSMTELWAGMSALLRTGLIIESPVGFGGAHWSTTPLLDRLCKLAPFENLEDEKTETRE